MKRILLLLVLCGHTIYIKAQVLRRPLAAMAGPSAYSHKQADVLSFIANQAALATLQQFSATIYMERRFGMPELTNYTIVTGLPTKHGNIGVALHRNGFSEYNENSLGLTYARRLGTRVNVGVQFNYHDRQLAGYGHVSMINAEAGVVWHLSEKLHAGMHVINAGAARSVNEEKLPSLYTFGCGYETGNKFFTGIEIIKEEDQPVTVNVLLQYRFIQNCMAAFGISTATSSVWIGARFYWRSFQIGVTASHHNQLGITPGLLFGLNAINKKS